MNSRLQVVADIAELPKILEWIQMQIGQTALNAKDQKEAELALEEAVVNVITHAAKEEPLEITLTCRYEPSRYIEFHLKDPGPPFNPLSHVSDPQVDASLEERQLGGIGLTIIRKYMDLLLYRREDNHNILTLIKDV